MIAFRTENAIFLDVNKKPRALSDKPKLFTFSKTLIN